MREKRADARELTRATRVEKQARMEMREVARMTEHARVFTALERACSCLASSCEVNQFARSSALVLHSSTAHAVSSPCGAEISWG